jgi:hypothetical protein
MKLEVSPKVVKKYSNIKLHENPPTGGGELFQACGGWWADVT